MYDRALRETNDFAKFAGKGPPIEARVLLIDRDFQAQAGTTEDITERQRVKNADDRRYALVIRSSEEF